MFFSCITRNINAIFLTAIVITTAMVKATVPIETIIAVQPIINTVEDKGINESSKWEIEIPKINLKAEIAEGTNVEVMNKYIGHFEETQEIVGNIGLAAHNRGYPVNYFSDLKKLEIGDKIIYRYFENKKEYLIDKIKVIKDTNWEPLKDTNENRITLITCIENEPEYRLCVQAVEIGGKYET